MAKFRKKPIEIEAAVVGVPGCADLARIIIESPSECVRRVDGSIDIHTPEGVMRANVGDWIIRGVKGELYPCKPDIFEATYERI